MNIIKEYEYKHNFIGTFIALLPFIVAFLILPKHYLYETNLALIALIIVLLNRYPHEYLHKFAGYLLGFKSKINFLRFSPTCTPERKLNSKELIIFSVFPLFGSTFFYGILSVIFFSISNSYIGYLFTSVAILSVYSAIGDIGYIINGFKYKNAIFEDQGAKLLIYEQ